MEGDVPENSPDSSDIKLDRSGIPLFPLPRTSANSGTRRRHEGAPPLVGESDLKPASELKP
jgi:hypothetical protein